VVVATSAVVYKAALCGVLRPWCALWPWCWWWKRVGVVWCWGLVAGCTMSGLLAVLLAIVINVLGASASVHVWQHMGLVLDVLLSAKGVMDDVRQLH